MSTQREIFNHFGLSPRRKDDLVKSKTYNRTREIILNSIFDSNWISFAGAIGAGKDVTVYSVLNEIQSNKRYRIIDLLSLDRNAVKISHILNSIVYQLADEYSDRQTPRRDMEARTMQVLNILSAAKKKGKKVVLVINEAQELHHMTVKAIKRLHELKFMGKGNLLTIIMIGQPGLAGKVDRDDEVRPRVDSYRFAYSRAEKEEQALHHSFGMLNRDEAREVVEQLGTPLEIYKGIKSALRKAYEANADSISLKYFDFPEKQKAPQRKPRNKIEVNAGDARAVDAQLKNVS